MPDFKKVLKEGILSFDGGYGTVFQQNGLNPGEGSEILNIRDPELVFRVHSEYLKAGARILKTNSFGINPLRYNDEKLQELLPGLETYEDRFNHFVLKPVIIASSAAKAKGKDVCVALDIGPLGKIVGKDISFEEAVEAFAAVVKAGANLCDLVLLETFGDLAELRAAIIAVKEHCPKPFVTTFVCGSDGRTFTGTTVEIMAKVCQYMGAAAIGFNCGNGPEGMLALLPRLKASTNRPLCLNPNAGLPVIGPDGKSTYKLDPETFADLQLEATREGVRILGGCCGTTPSHIAALNKKLEGMAPVAREYTAQCGVSSATQYVSFDKNDFTVIGERINPTGKPKLKDALRRGDIEYLAEEAIAQKNAGADILDVNTGLADIDERDMLTRAVEKIQNIVDLPLQIDSSDPVAMEKALRVYNGIALINSVNGSEKSMNSVLPLAAKYGGVLVCLTLDEKGIPDTPEGRYEIAARIVNEAKRYGIGKKRVIFDALTLTLGSDPQAADKTLAAVRMIKEKLGVNTSLGVSNISFGLPDREKVNCAFLEKARESGLDAAIMNPLCEPMMQIARGSVSGSASDSLYAVLDGAKVAQVNTDTLDGCIYSGLAVKASELARKLCETKAPTDVISGYVVPALDRTGKDFESGKVFLPGLLAAADAAIGALDVITSFMPSGEGQSKGRVIVATVEGDVHDIGKNIVAVMLRSYGFEVIDLGKNVPAETVAAAVKTSGARVVGLSALMTTTLPSMEKTVKLLKSECPGVRISVGGAVLTKEYADRIGADNYSPEATETVRFAGEVYSNL